jgi:hypothetical protein
LKEAVKELKQSDQKQTDVDHDTIRRIAVLEQRCAALEKHSDRSWQVWLALLGALVALLIAIFKK